MREGNRGDWKPSAAEVSEGYLPTGRSPSLGHAVKAARLTERFAVEPVAIEEDRVDVTKIAEVLGNVAIDQDDVGGLSLRNRADAVVHADHPCWNDRRGLE